MHVSKVSPCTNHFATGGTIAATVYKQTYKNKGKKDKGIQTSPFGLLLRKSTDCPLPSTRLARTDPRTPGVSACP